MLKVYVFRRSSGSVHVTRRCLLDVSHRLTSRSLITKLQRKPPFDINLVQTNLRDIAARSNDTKVPATDVLHPSME